MKNEKLKSRKIHGKDYVEVNERLRFFRQNYPGHSIITEIISIYEDRVTLGAKILDPDGRVLSTGHAHEEKASSNINKTSYVENGETSAIGRALGIFGIGIDGGVASADEVDMAITRQTTARLFDGEEITYPSAPAESIDPKWTAQELFGEEDPNLDAYLVSIGWIAAGESFKNLSNERLIYAIDHHEKLTVAVDKYTLSNNAKLRSAVGGAISKGDLS